MEGAGLLLHRLNLRERFEKNRLEDSVEDAKAISQLAKGIHLTILLAAGIINMSKCTLSAFYRRFSERPLPRSIAMVLQTFLRDCNPESRSLLDCLSLMMNTDEISESIVFREHDNRGGIRGKFGGSSRAD